MFQALCSIRFLWFSMYRLSLQERSGGSSRCPTLGQETSCANSSLVLPDWRILNDLGSVTLLHINLCLAQGFAFRHIVIVLLLQVDYGLVELCNLSCRLSLYILSNFLIFCLVYSLKGLILILQLLVLLLELHNCRISSILNFFSWRGNGFLAISL